MCRACHYTPTLSRLVCSVKTKPLEHPKRANLTTVTKVEFDSANILFLRNLDARFFSSFGEHFMHPVVKINERSLVHLSILLNLGLCFGLSHRCLNFTLPAKQLSNCIFQESIKEYTPTNKKCQLDIKQKQWRS